MPSATFTVSSGSERVVEVYPERERPSSRGSASVHSPNSSGSHSFSSGSWSEVGPPYEDDGIEPSDSASRSRQPSRRRHTTETRPAPTRRHSSRRVNRGEEVPRRHSTHRHHPSQHRRAESRRTPSDESGSVASYYDDYPPGHHGAPMPPRAYPPPAGYRHGHGGYPPSVTSGAPYPDAYGQALVHMPHDPFAYQQANPFSPQGQPGNPFSPISTGGASYFTTDPHAAPPPMAHHHRPPGPPRPQSYAAPSSYHGSDVMSHYPLTHFPGYAVPPGYPPMPWGYPTPSQAGSPAPQDGKKESEMEAFKKEKEIEALKMRLAKAEAEAAAVAEEKAAAEAEKKRKADMEAASKAAKEEAEKKAAGEAKTAKEEAEKKLEEAKKKHEEAEKKVKGLEEEAKKNQPSPDSQKAPIKFKDAVGRTFRFPYQVCKTWKGMEELIKQAFLHIDMIGDHVQRGHYDLLGPDGEIILPKVWDTVIQPDWEVTMHMWPMPEEKKKEKEKEKHEVPDDSFADLNFGPLAHHDMMRKKKDKSKDGGRKKRSNEPAILDMNIPPPPPAPPMRSGEVPGGVLPDPLGLAGFFPPPLDDKRRSKSRSKSSKDLPPLTRWMIGGQPAKKDDEKLDLVRHKSSHSHSSEQTACAVM